MGSFPPIPAKLKHPGLRRYLLNSGWLMLERALFAAVNIFVGIFIARHLGPADFGLFNSLLSVVTIMAAIAKLGIDGVMVRELLTRADRQMLDLGVAFWLMAAGSLLSSLALLAGMAALGFSDQVLIYTTLALSLVVVQPFTVIDMYCQSQVRAGIPAACRVMVMLIGAALKVTAVVQGYPLMAFFVITALEQAVLIASYVIVGRVMQVAGMFRHFATPRARELMRASWPMLINAIALAVNVRVAQILVALLLDDQAAGEFAAATRLYEAWIYIPFVVMTSVAPALLNARARDRAQYLKRLVDVTRILAGLSACVFAFFLLFGQQVIALTFGASYAGSWLPLVVLLASSVPAALGTVTARYFVFEHREKAVAIRTVLAAVVNICGGLVLIPAFGVVGASAGVLLSLVIANYLALLVLPRDAEVRGVIHRALIPFWRAPRG